MIVVSDTTILSNLFQVGRAELLPTLYGEVIIPEAVRDELARLDSSLPVALPWLRVQAVSDTGAVLNLLAELDRGEAEAIVLAQELRADWVLMDERPGRRVAAQRHLRVTGTLGVLLEAKRSGLLDAIGPVIREIQQKAGTWYHPQLLSEVLREAHER